MHTLSWGPPVGVTTVEDDFVDLLLKDSESLTEDARPDLAGIIENEKYYNPERWDVYCKHLSKPINEYLNWLLSTHGRNIDMSKVRWQLDKLWVNKQRRFEYNPPHDHSGELSFVIYLKVPEEVYESDEKYPQHKWPGQFNFTTGHNNDPGAVSIHAGNLHPFVREIHQALQYKNLNSLKPTNNDMYIFPSWLTHQVMGFVKDVERISVSGNITLFNEDMVKRNDET